MRNILAFLALLGLLTGIFTGNAVHAAEPLSQTMLMEDDGALHSDGDHDEVPADGHADYPHHHNGCTGHDVGAGSAKIAGPGWPHDGNLDAGRYAMNIAEAPPGTDLRPPIA